MTTTDEPLYTWVKRLLEAIMRFIVNLITLGKVLNADSDIARIYNCAFSSADFSVTLISYFFFLLKMG